MSKKVYFYQNNPCTIVRDLSDEHAEIRLVHRFAEGLDGSQWCTPCNVGPLDGAHPAHACEEYQDVIDIVSEEENIIFCIVEKRLLNENPIEKIEINKLKEQVQKEAVNLQKTKSLHEEWRLSLKAKQAKVQSLTSEINSIKLDIEANKKIRTQSESGIDALTDEYNKISVAIGHGSKNISMKEYDRLLKRDEILTALEAGGVDNWQWYDESLKGVKS